MTEEILTEGTPRGSRHYRARLEESDIPLIFQLYRHGKLTIYQIAEKFDVHPTTIWYVIIRKTWKHVPLPSEE